MKARTTYTNLGEVIRCWRLIHQVTLRGLAALIGTSPSTLMRLEHGRAIDADTYLKILNWLAKRMTVVPGR